MKYSVVFSPEAEAEFLALPPALEHHILDHLELLADEPVRRSERSKNSGGHQVYKFFGIGGDSRTRVTVEFQYSQDEMSLIVSGIEVEQF